MASVIFVSITRFSYLYWLFPMHEHIAIPDYPDVIWAFAYRGMKIEITTCLHHDQKVYSAWVTYATGSAVAVPKAYSRESAIARAKKWIHTHFDWSQK